MIDLALQLMNECTSIRQALHGKKFDYSTERYPFKEILEEIYGIPLDEIHKWLGNFDKFSKYNDQNTLAHKVFYANFKFKFKDLYSDFISNVISEVVPYDFYYQKIPTFRIGLPGNRFVGEFHKDTHYNHQDYEINFNVGLENYLGKAALKTEDYPKSENYIYLESPYGKCFSFNHIDCMHGSEENLTSKTMVSFDFRLALKEFYFDSDSNSIGIGTKFKTGKYFSSDIIQSKCKK